MIKLFRDLSVGLYLCIYFVILSIPLLSQPCSVGGVITTQEEIDNFPTNCYTIYGNLLIKEAVPGTITNFDGFQNVTHWLGELGIVNNASLNDISGFSNVVEFGDLSFSNNDGLTSLSGLESVEEVYKLTIFSNDNLSDLTGLNNLTTSNSYILIINNAILSSLNGLDALETVYNNFQIEDNPNLHSLQGIPNLTNVPSALLLKGNGFNSLTGLNANVNIGTLMLQNTSNLSSAIGLQFGNIGKLILDNTSFVTLAGFENLDSLTGLYLFNNHQLLSLNGIENLASIESNFTLYNNNSLINIEAIESTDLSSSFNLKIKYNSNLSNCAIASICTIINSPSTYTTIQYNSSGCNSQTEVETACAALPIEWSKVLEVNQLNKTSKLFWSVAQQINNEKFIIEHSKDGAHFQSIGEIKGGGNLSTEIDYEYTHESPPIGANYYRIKQMDYDGRFDYSNIAYVMFLGDGSNKIRIYPNPVTDIVTIHSLVNRKLNIYNQLGLIVSKNELQEGKNEINMSNYHSGIYLFKTENGEVRKVVKK